MAVSFMYKDNQPLADAIKQGMEAALSDGSLIELLKTHPFSKDALGKADLQNRVKINIESPGTNDSFKILMKNGGISPKFNRPSPRRPPSFSAMFVQGYDAGLQRLNVTTIMTNGMT
ncbi:hypothetical protein QWZ16_24465 [Vibrio ostreicida]|uniref:Uncharacterized protein n=1 Tax=Vibrio ostreicida TaxID=526588 RepID=A0ABT8BZZ0_9VIBR|nr:hypothetical protein [Vibrio ostreicida]MDN3612722.1 hypothetical protein [Vibrio ostreicida]